MTTAFFDCFNGISGDMVLGALLDLGLPLNDLRSALKALPVEGWRLDAQPVKRCGIAGTLARVTVSEKQPHRHFSDVKRIIDESAFSDIVKSRAVTAFRWIADAEAAVHGIAVEKVHFHEVGAVDAIVDICGAMWGLNELGVVDGVCPEVAVGGGTVSTQHGEMPVPAPATARILAGVPIRTGPMQSELATPTGAAILRTICSRFGPVSFVPERSGYGAGSREFPGQSNYLRIILGKVSGEATLPIESRELAIIQTEIDDMPGEQFGFLLERLFASGCLDAHIIPIQMKKNRPAASVEVLVDPARISETIELLLRETSTFGVKVLPCTRYCLARRFETVETQYGPVRVKIGLWGEDVLKVSPEYEDCRKIALEKRISLHEVYAAARSAARQRGLPA